jgi:hypothetical protein
VVRGVQLSTGTLLMVEGIKFMLGVTFASNLAAGFMVGIVVAWMLKMEKLQV